MSYLYEHRDQLGEDSRLVEIAYSVTFSIPDEDREDVEQKIVIELIDVKKKVSVESYLWGAARHMVGRYWEEKYTRINRTCYITETNKGEIAEQSWRYLAAPDGADARLDAMAVLSSLPPRMVEIGLKKLNGERLTDAERLYTQRHRKNLNVTGQGHRITDEEVSKIVELKRKGLRNIEIVRITGRSIPSVKMVLRGAGLG